MHETEEYDIKKMAVSRINAAKLIRRLDCDEVKNSLHSRNGPFELFEATGGATYSRRSQRCRRQ
ncbi:hypothetical protein PC116_g5872 [Phytophthora cactorum]|nr:hypothetical protein PC114_g23175 [Phytophthora cactorum]KAG4246379.1 hypothetical protein PC116_g5872 [Phytophthora cactorum]